MESKLFNFGKIIEELQDNKAKSIKYSLPILLIMISHLIRNIINIAKYHKFDIQTIWLIILLIFSIYVVIIFINEFCFIIKSFSWQISVYKKSNENSIYVPISYTNKYEINYFNGKWTLHYGKNNIEEIEYGNFDYGIWIFKTNNSYYILDLEFDIKCKDITKFKIIKKNKSNCIDILTSGMNF